MGRPRLNIKCKIVTCYRIGNGGKGLCHACYMIDYYKNHSELKKLHLIYCKKHLDELRMKLFNILGGPVCIKCGFSDIRALQFDHINGGGRKDYKKKYPAQVMYRYYVAHPDEAKQKLQVLCANCNWIKREENNEHN